MATNLKAVSFPVKTECEIYQILKSKWEKANLVYHGEDEIHLAGKKIMPKLEREDTDEFNFFIELTRFVAVYKKTIKGLEGTVNRKEHESNLTDIEDLLENFDNNGTNFESYRDMILNLTLKDGYCGTLVDYNSSILDDGGELSIKEAEDLNLRPKACLYNAQSIINWNYDVINNTKQLVLIVLKETLTKKINKFESEEYEKYRVLELVPRIDNENIYEYVQTVHIIKDGEEQILEPIIPKIDNKSLDYIPFEFHGEIENPPLYDLVLANIKHYQLQNTLARLLWWLGCPTPYRTGVNPDDPNLPKSLGAASIWNIENDKAKIGLLEFSGNGADAIRNELKDIKEDMAYLGANMLITSQLQNETATKTLYRNSSETASLTEIVNNLSQSFTRVLKILALWNGKSGENIYFIFNNDFDITKLTAQEILARVTSWQAGAFSKRSLYLQLKQGEVELASDTFEEEEELINNGQ